MILPSILTITSALCTIFVLGRSSLKWYESFVQPFCGIVFCANVSRLVPRKEKVVGERSFLSFSSVL